MQAHQCDSGQGFLYARPLEADALTEFLSSRPADQSPSTGAAHSAMSVTGPVSRETTAAAEVSRA